jgi:hypothetical protein
MKVENITSKKGNKVSNQFIIYGDDGSETFQSYSSTIAVKKEGKVYIYPHWDYSTTTGKYRNLFLGENKAETLKKLKSGEYISVGFEVA